MKRKIVKKDNVTRYIIAGILLAGVCFGGGFLIGQVSTATDPDNIYGLIQEKSHWELKSLHYLHLLNRCEGKE